MITYKYSTQFKKDIPVLITVRIQQLVSYDVMSKWLQDHCQHKYYILPSYAGVGCQFEDNEDATLFFLRWC